MRALLILSFVFYLIACGADSDNERLAAISNMLKAIWVVLIFISHQIWEVKK